MGNLEADKASRTEREMSIVTHRLSVKGKKKAGQHNAEVIATATECSIADTSDGGCALREKDVAILSYLVYHAYMPDESGC